jgi:hypothetical protein
MGVLPRAPLPLVLGVGLVWGFVVNADSAQFSALVSEQADQRYVGTALTLQLALGFVLTFATIWLIPVARDLVGWRWAFALLALGPALGIAAMLRLEPVGRPGHHRARGGVCKPPAGARAGGPSVLITWREEGWSVGRSIAAAGSRSGRYFGRGCLQAYPAPAKGLGRPNPPHRARTRVPVLGEAGRFGRKPCQTHWEDHGWRRDTLKNGLSSASAPWRTGFWRRRRRVPLEPETFSDLGVVPEEERSGNHPRPAGPYRVRAIARRPQLLRSMALGQRRRLHDHSGGQFGRPWPGLRDRSARRGCPGRSHERSGSLCPPTRPGPGGDVGTGVSSEPSRPPPPASRNSAATDH